MTSNPQIAANSIPDELHPCEHMVSLVSRRSDGTLAGPAKWYTDFHLLTCPHCREAVRGLKLLREVVASQAALAPKEAPRLKPEEWENLEKSWKGDA